MRRGFAVFVHLLLFQFLLLGSGDACVLPAVVGGVRAASTPAVPGGADAMAGMEMAGARGVAHGGMRRSTACEAPRDHSGGSVPHAPAGCQTFAVCAAVAIGAANPDAVECAFTRAVVGRTAFVTRRLASRTAAPEPPPPRV